MNPLTILLLSCFLVFGVVTATGSFGSNGYGGSQGFGQSSGYGYGAANPYSYLMDNANDLNNQVGGSYFSIIVVLMFVLIISLSPNLSFSG